MPENGPSGSMSGVWKRSTVELLRHRQTKEPGTDRLHLHYRATLRLYSLQVGGSWARVRRVEADGPRAVERRRGVDVLRCLFGQVWSHRILWAAPGATPGEVRGVQPPLALRRGAPSGDFDIPRFRDSAMESDVCAFMWAFAILVDVSCGEEADVLGQSSDSSGCRGAERYQERAGRA